MSAATLLDLIEEVSDGGLSAAHGPRTTPGYAVGAAAAEEANALAAALTPIACWRVEDARFDFDSSFIQPQMRQEVQFLVRARDRLTAAGDDGKGGTRRQPPPISLFAHADPTGDDDYNKRLSGRRAKATYALLTKNVAMWESLHSTALGKDDWGIRAIQTMLAEVGDGGPAVSGVDDPPTQDATRRFQQQQGLKADGSAGPKTRAALFRAYMDALCGPDFRLDPERDFLGRGQDAGGRGDYQGCGEFNPVLLMSQAQDNAFAKESDHTRRNAANAPNRRVLVLLFAPGSRVEPSRWPCPRAEEGSSVCRKRFWSDGEARCGKRLPDEQRAWEKSADTFACRFYHRLVRESPCERPVRAGYTEFELDPVTPDSPSQEPLGVPPDADLKFGRSEPSQAPDEEALT